jgi:protein gp37
MRKTVRPTEIDWATHAWGPVEGCWGPTGTPDAPARCPGCYAESYCRRFHRDFAPHLCENEFPAAWSQKPAVVFVGPRTDLWSAGVPQEWRDRVFAEIWKCEEPMDAVVLTKRPQEFTDADREWFLDIPYLWVGVSVAGPDDWIRYCTLCLNGPRADRRVLSIEPMLSDPRPPGKDPRPGWLMIGPRTPVCKQDPETGGKASEIIRDCVANGIPEGVAGCPASAGVAGGDVLQGE